MRRAIAITLTPEECSELTRWSKGRSIESRRAERAKVVLLAADGLQTKEIADQLGIPRQKVARWRNRFSQDRINGIKHDASRCGRPTTLTAEQISGIIHTTLHVKPDNATHWSIRTLAKHLGFKNRAVHKVWRSQKIKPHLTKTFKVSNDPHFAEKVIDVVGLYLNPPEHAIVLSVDEKTQIQALDRTQKSLPLYPGRLGTMTHDSKRHGTTSLFAAINVADGRIHARCDKRHTHKEWLSFLKQLDRETDKGVDLHIILDNYATHKEAPVMKWLKKHPRIHLHFIPTSSSWLNIIERWFRDLTDKQLRCGVFKSVTQLEEAIWSYIEHHNISPTAFKWTAKAEKIIEQVKQAKIVLDKLQTN